MDYSNASASVVLVVTDALVYDGIDLTDPVQSTSDLDGDGLSNLLEYAVGTDPRDPADAQVGLQFSIAPASGGEYVTLRFRRRKNSPGLPIQYLPEVSSDGQNWHSDPLNISAPVVTPLDSQFDWVTVKDLTPAIANAPRFVRLHIIAN